MGLIKSILKNKLDFIIIMLIIIVSLSGINIVFNLVFNAYMTSRETEIFAENNTQTTLNLNDKVTAKEVNDILIDLHKNNIPFAFNKATTLNGEIFDVNLQLNFVSDSNLYQYKVVKGRNISLDDINNNNKVIVISSNYKDFFYKKGQDYFIDIEGTSYKIIGIIENRYSYDWYNLKAFTPYDFKNGFNDEIATPMISFYSKKDVNISEDIKLKNNISEVINTPLEKIPLKAELETLMSEILYYFILSVLSIINLCIFIIFFIEKRKNTISILRSVGYNRNKSGNYVLKQILFIAIVSSLISWLIYYPFSKYFNEKFMGIGLKASPIILVFDLIFIIFILLLLKLIIFKVILKNEIQKDIKKRKNILDNTFVKVFIIIQISLMINYSIEFYTNNKEVNKTLNTANSIIDFENTLVIDSFSVNYDSNVLKSYNIETKMKNLTNKGIQVVNYLYAVDSAKEVKSMNNLEKDNYSPNYKIYLENIEKNHLPLLYISNSSLKTLKIKGLNQGNKDLGQNLVYAGNDYKEHFNIGDIIKGNSGAIYKIAGFIDKDQYMFDENSGSEVLSQFNKLDSFLIIPFEIANLENLNVPKNAPIYDSDSEKFYTLSNTFIKYKDDNEMNYIKDELKKDNLNTVTLDIQLKRFTHTNFNYVKYKLFNSLIISIIALIGVICYIISFIYSEKRNIGIKRALGYKSTKIITGYIFKIIELLFVSNILVILYKMLGKFTVVNIDNFITIFTINILILVIGSILIIYYIKKDKISELIKERD